MGTAGFRLDLNFAFLMHCKLRELFSAGELLKDQAKESMNHMALLNEAQDNVFQKTMRRNFTPCPLDDTYYIFKDNPEDSVLPPGKKWPSQR